MAKTIKRTVMIIDDEADIRNIIKTALKKEGYAVITAANGNEGLEKLKKHKVDLILLDIMMPGMTTKQIVPKIKNSKIAYLTLVKVTEAEKQELLKPKNTIDFLEKPFKINELVSSVKRMLNR